MQSMPENSGFFPALFESSISKNKSSFFKKKRKNLSYSVSHKSCLFFFFFFGRAEVGGGGLRLKSDDRGFPCEGEDLCLR